MSDLLEALRTALEGEPAWLVGGAVRDELLGRGTRDYDVAVSGDPRAAARRIARRTRGAAFSLSEAFGAWRVSGPGGGWHVDVVALKDGDLAADLRARDFTINAMARPLDGGEVVDPLGGSEDLRARRLRLASPGALESDPLRALRAVRFSAELGVGIEPDTGAAVRAAAPTVARVAGERVFAELKRIVCADAAVAGLALMEAHGLTEVVLPELAALHGVRQSVYHHLDVHDHTIAVLEAVALLERDPAATGLTTHAGAVRALLSEPLADELTRGQGMRFAALLHDAAKPMTRATSEQGRVTFIGHDAQGARMAADAMRRLRCSQRLVEYVSALTRSHLKVGFMVHERPLTRRAAWRYLQETAPYEAEITVFTVADRLATRGRNAAPAIAAHVALADELLSHAFERRSRGRPPALVRGDDLMREAGIPPGRRLGEILAQLQEDAYAGELSSREDALRRARQLAREGTWAPGPGRGG